MGRKSKLTDTQWAEIGRRLARGEKHADLAREYGVDRAQVTRRFSATIRNVKNVAHQIVSAEEALVALPIAQQFEALSLADELRAISTHLAGAGKKAAMLSHRLIGLAHLESDKIDETNLVASVESLKTVSALTKMANDASTIPLNLLAANKETVKRVNEPEERDVDDDARANQIAERLESTLTERTTSPS